MSRWTARATPRRPRPRSHAAQRRIATRAALILAVILLGFGAITFALWVGGRDVMAGRMTGGELSAFVLYAVLLATSGASLSEVWGEMQRAAGAARPAAGAAGGAPAITAPGRAARRCPSRCAAASPSRMSASPIPPRPDRPALDGFSFVGRAGRDGGAGRPLRRRQDHGAAAAAALLRPAMAGASRWTASTSAQLDPAGACARGWAWCRRTRWCSARRRPRTSATAAPTRATRRCWLPPSAAAAAGFIDGAAAGLRHASRRQGGDAVGRAAPAHRHRARHPARPARAAAGRGDQRAGCGERAGGAAGARPRCRRAAPRWWWRIAWRRCAAPTASW